MKDLAIVLCRVSSLEQLKNNSLGHQKDNGLKAADELNVTIPEDGIWAGQQSSKKGVNYNRKDLKQMFEYCQKNKRVRYLIVQEVDRFMRSPDEQTYWYVRFWYELKVRIWFADKPELNEDTHVASLLRYMEGWRAGGSNEERINKSINGITAAIKEGKWPFPPKAGYMRGHVRCVPDIHPDEGPPLQAALKRVARRELGPRAALDWLNTTSFTKNRSLLKIDKFLAILADEFYAGMIVIDKQVKARNEHGAHEPLITLEEHRAILAVLASRKKNKSYTKKQFNPDYPLNKHMLCAPCMGVVSGKLVGFNLSNGRGGVFPRYRCRNCWTLFRREEVHDALDDLLDDFWMDEKEINSLIEALQLVWAENAREQAITIVQIRTKIANTEQELRLTIDAMIEPQNKPYMEDFRNKADKLKLDIEKLKNEVVELEEAKEYDLENFIKFGLEFSHKLAGSWRSLEADDLGRFKQLIFPDDLLIGPDKIVYTSKISPVYSLGRMKRGSEEPPFSQLVRVKGL